MSALAQFLSLRPHGGFSMIMADPPWLFDLRSGKGEEKSPQAQYSCMETHDICMLPVEAIASENALLWLWATNPMLPHAFAVMEAWGFTYKTAGVWVKRTKMGKDAFGTGYVLRSSHEPFLIGTRGAPKTTKSTRSIVPTFDDDEAGAEGLPWGEGSITIEALAREHSRKPDEAFVAAENLMPGARRIEIFSRERRDGWEVWGNEIDKFEGAA